MHELLNWYVEELRQLLSGRLPADKLATILDEARSHLNESAMNRLPLAGSEREAMVSAIDAYGSPRRIAESYLHRAPRKLLGLPPAWTAAIGAFVAIYCWNFHWLTLSGYFDNFGETWQNAVAGCVGVSGLLLIALSCRAGYRSNWRSILGTTALSAALSVPLVAFWIVGSTQDQQGLSRFHLSRDVERVNGTLSKIDRYEAMLVEGNRDYQKVAQSAQLKSDWQESAGMQAQGNLFLSHAPTDAVVLSELPRELKDSAFAAAQLGESRFNPAVVGNGTSLDKGGPFIVPRMFGSFALVDGRVIVFETVQRFSEAQAAWLKYGQRDFAQLGAQRDQMVGLLKSADAAEHGRLFFFNQQHFAETIVITLSLLPLLLLVDAVAALASRPRRRWSSRQLA